MHATLSVRLQTLNKPQRLQATSISKFLISILVTCFLQVQLHMCNVMHPRSYVSNINHSRIIIGSCKQGCHESPLVGGEGVRLNVREFTWLISCSFVTDHYLFQCLKVLYLEILMKSQCFPKFLSRDIFKGNLSTFIIYSLYLHMLNFEKLAV